MYQGAKSRIVKVGGYALMGFFVIIIIISFGLPTDWMGGRKEDPNTVAVVNGEKIFRVDLARMVDRMTGRKGSLPDEQIAYLLNMLINDKLQVQYAKKLGIEVTDARVVQELRSAFTDPQTKQVNNQLLKRSLESINLSVEGALAMEKSRLVQSEMGKLFTFGSNPSKEEIAFQNALDKSSFQIRYSFLSNEEFKKKNGGTYAATDAEIDAEMSANKKEIENPATDRVRFRDKIIERKLSESKKNFVAAIDLAASRGDSFDKTAAMLGGKTGTSDMFKPGDMIKEQGKEGKPLFSLNDNEAFRNGFASLSAGASSRAVIAADGIYIFTPLKKDFKNEMPSEKDFKTVSDKVAQVKQQSIQSSVFLPFIESADVVRNLKK